MRPHRRFSLARKARALPPTMMTRQMQTACRMKTMEINRLYHHDGFVPVAHIGGVLKKYILDFQKEKRIAQKPRFALGGIVPNLLRAPKALPYDDVLNCLFRFRSAFSGKQLHVFGIGGTATVHLAALLNFDSVDSNGWRNRAARGIVQLPGKGDRIAVNLGSWRGRELEKKDIKILKCCQCPACVRYGLGGIRKNGMEGFCHRATHNLWILLQESEWALKKIRQGDYEANYESWLDNSTYLPLIRKAIEIRHNLA